MKIKHIFVFVFFFFISGFAAADDVAVRNSSQSSARSTITINTEISTVRVTLNGTYVGTTPLLLNNLTPGTYRLLLQKKGFRDREIFIEVEFGKEKTFYFDMQPVTGGVALSVMPRAAFVFIDGEQINKDIEKTENPSGEYSLNLSAGSHKILVRLFGYADEEATITVVDGITVSAALTLRPAIFAVSDFQVSPQAFNPDNPGKIGVCAIRFSVSSRGSGTVVILNEEGNEIKTLRVSDFSAREQFVFWDGTDEEGERVPDGTYTAVLTAIGNKEQTPITISSRVKINSAVFNIAQITAVGSGASMMPFPLTLSGNARAAGFTLAPLWISGKELPDVPLIFRFAANPMENVEYAISGGLHFLGSANTPVSFGAAVKYAREIHNFYYGALLRYGYSTQSRQFDTAAGLGFSLLAGYAQRMDSVRRNVMTLHYNTATSVIYGGNNGVLSNDSPLWWKNSIAANAQYSFFSLALWSELLSAFNVAAGHQSWLEVISVGTDFCFLIPDTSTQISAGFSAHIGKDFYALSPAIGAAFFF